MRCEKKKRERRNLENRFSIFAPFSFSPSSAGAEGERECSKNKRRNTLEKEVEGKGGKRELRLWVVKIRVGMAFDKKEFLPLHVKAWWATSPIRRTRH